MNFSLIDGAGLALATLLFVPILVLPGLGLAALFETFGFRALPDARKALVGLAVGLAVLPGIDSVVARFIGLGTALALNLGLAAVAVGLILRHRWRIAPPPMAMALALAWFVVLGFEWIDFDIAGKLYQPYTSFDLVKHAATTQAIQSSGAPPHDPFFLRPERVSYYYFFYTLAALAQRFGGGLFDARIAVGGLAFWVGIGLFALADLVMERAGLRRGGDAGRARLTLAALLACSGLDILFVLLRYATKGVWLPDPAWWNEQVTSWFESLLWVPHHVTGLIALFVGFAASVEALEAASRRRVAAVVLAGLAFASALGLSVWVTFAGAVTALAWVAVLAVERRWRACLILGLVALVALVAAAPQLADLRTGRGGALPIALTVRAFTPLDQAMGESPWLPLARLILLPLNYFAEFGIFFLGTILFWRDRRRPGLPVTELGRVLAIGAGAGLVLGTFLCSLLFNNDLGWRVMLLPQLATLAWTASAIDARLARLPRPKWRHFLGAAGRPAAALLVVGFATTAYACAGLRLYYLAGSALPKSAQVFHDRPAVEHATRTAYAWANANMPADAVLQHNPHDGEGWRRATAFGLYGRNRVGVSDAFGSLFGADAEAVTARLRALGSIFSGTLRPAEVRTLAQAAGVDALVAVASDAAWGDASSWIWTAKPLYATDQVRIVPVAGLAAPPSSATR